MMTATQERKRVLEAELARVLDLIVGQYKPQAVYLFGSLVTGELSPWSDLDLAIVKDTQESFFDRVATVLNLVRPRVGMDICVYTPREWDELAGSRRFVREEVLARGKRLYAA